MACHAPALRFLPTALAPADDVIHASHEDKGFRDPDLAMARHGSNRVEERVNRDDHGPYDADECEGDALILEGSR